MKLLEIAPTNLDGGVNRYVQTILAEAGKRGWELHIAFPDDDGAAAFQHTTSAAGVICHPLEISMRSLPRLRSYREIVREIGRTMVLLHKVKPDIVHISVPWPLQYLNYFLACALLRIPTAVVFHLFPEGLSFSPRVVRVATWARSRNQQWIAVSTNNLKNISSSLQVPREEIICIYNGIRARETPLNGTRDVDMRCLVRRELGLPETARMVLTVGRLDPQKGYDDLIPSIPELAEEFPDLVFIWAGKGELQDYLMRRLDEDGVANRVMLLGQRSDVARLMQASDLFVFPSHYEGLPFAILEAMAFGLPIVASDSGGTPEVIVDGQHGLLSRRGDSPSLLRAIRWALAHPGKMEEVAASAQIRVKEFSEEKMLTQTFEVLERLSRSSRKQGA